MAKNTSVTLGEHYDQMIANQLATGRYATASEIIRAGLRLFEEREEQIAALREAIQRGLDSGIDHSFDFDEFIAEIDGD